MLDLLTLEHFFKCTGDQEQSYYQIMAALDPYKGAFRKNRLQPHLDFLHDLLANIQHIITVKDFIQEDDQRLEPVFELMELAYPDIQAIYEEGVMLEEFVKDNIQLEHIGVIPDHTTEGYVVLHDNKRRSLHIYRYTTPNVFPLKINIKRIYSIESRGIIPDMRSIKLNLLSNFKDLPAPAIWELYTPLDFPFERTILPVSKQLVLNAIQ